MNPILDEIAKTSIQLMLKEPFYGHFFTSVLKDVTDKTDSVAISLSGKQMLKLIVNEEYWKDELSVSKVTEFKDNIKEEEAAALLSKLLTVSSFDQLSKEDQELIKRSLKNTFDEKASLKLMVSKKGELSILDEEATKKLRYGSIKHQILHIVFKHILRIGEFGNKQLYGIAADLAANQYIGSEQLTEESIRLEDFPEFKLDRGQSLDYYYKRLSEELDQMTNSAQGDGEEDGVGDGDDQEDGSNSDDEDTQELNQAQQKLKELLEQPDHRQLNQHKFWEEIAKMSSSERKMMEMMINESIINSVQRTKDKHHGTLPAGLQQYIDLLMESLKPNVNWRRVLRIFAASSSRTFLKNTIRRPSKRYGTTPGIKIQRKQKLLVAVDTSGSVNDDELKEFFGELYHIWKQGAEIFVVECDANIHNKYFYKGIPPSVISGRGGTDFNAPLQYANDVYNPDAIVYFTDGYATAPEVASRKPILWMITGQGISETEWDYLPGRKVKMIKQISF